MKTPALIAFRVDASLSMGSGHVMRCLTLAEALRARGAQCLFITRAHPGHMAAAIEQRGFPVRILPAGPAGASSTEAPPPPPASLPPHHAWLGCDWKTDAQQTLAALSGRRPYWLVVDHYALDARWEGALRPHCERILVLDDLADRPHACDVLLDQNLGRHAQDYAQLVPTPCQLLIGPQYALLRPEFASLREYSLRRRQTPQLQRLLITMGGVDQANATAAVLAALRMCPLPEDCHITVVMGPHAPWLAQVQNLAATLPWTTEVRVNVDNMAQLMADSDVAIGAAGSTSWERCCLGLPTLMLVLASNQESIASALNHAGAALALHSTWNEAVLEQHLAHFIEVPGRIVEMSNVAQSLVDGQGANRVCEILLQQAAQ